MGLRWGLGGRVIDCSGAGTLVERLPQSVDSGLFQVLTSLPCYIKFHSVMPKGKAISYSFELHTQGVPCTLITNLILGHHLPDTTTLLSSHTGSLFWSHSKCLLMP